MPTYLWKGKNRYGDVVGGERVAASTEELNRLLQKDQITVTSIAPVKKGLQIPFLKRGLHHRRLEMTQRPGRDLLNGSLAASQRPHRRHLRGRGPGTTGSALRVRRARGPGVSDRRRCS